MNTIVNDIAYDPILFQQSGLERTKNEKVAQEMESLFIHQLMKEMDATIEREEEGFLYSEYEKTYRSLFNQEVAREVSRAGGIGIQDMVASELPNNGEKIQRTATENHRNQLTQIYAR